MTLGAALLLVLLFFVGSNLWILARTYPVIESSIAQCGPQQVGIVFGTSHWTRSGSQNPHFYARMTTAAGLVHAERVEHLLLSGDNRTQSYNEPRAMWRALTGFGVSPEQLTLDYAGFSTFDTLVRAQHVFALDEAVLVTQRWHLPRALYIGQALGLQVSGCVASNHSVDGEWRLRIREWVARVATLGDLYIWKRQAYFLGPAEPIEFPVDIEGTDTTSEGAGVEPDQTP
ncbi:MAG: SanA/YdcF family protein [Pseudomonadota bacterium]